MRNLFGHYCGNGIGYKENTQSDCQKGHYYQKHEYPVCCFLEEMLFGVGSTVSTAGAAMSLAQNVRFRLASTVGDFMEVKRTQVNFALSSGSSVTVASIPAGSFVVGITARVTTAVTGPTGFDIGDGVDVDRWGNSIAVALGTTVDITDYTASELSLFPTISDIVITSDGVDFTGGVVRIVVHHMSLSAPTS